MQTCTLLAQAILGDARKREGTLRMKVAVHLDDAVKTDDDSTALRLVDGDFELVARNHWLHELESVNLEKHVEVLFEVFGRLFDD